jgi:hypothetical protein
MLASQGFKQIIKDRLNGEIFQDCLSDFLFLLLDTFKKGGKMEELNLMGIIAGIGFVVMIIILIQMIRERKKGEKTPWVKNERKPTNSFQEIRSQSKEWLILSAVFIVLGMACLYYAPNFAYGVLGMGLVIFIRACRPPVNRVQGIVTLLGGYLSGQFVWMKFVVREEKMLSLGPLILCIFLLWFGFRTRGKSDLKTKEKAEEELTTTRPFGKEDLQVLEEEYRRLEKQQAKTSKEKDRETKIECADCRTNFLWADAYKCQDTPGAAPHNLYNTDFLPRAFCPHCGALVVQWHITKEKDFDDWIWFGENKRMNLGRPFPGSPIAHGWGISIPPQFVPKYSEHRLDIKKIKQQTAVSSSASDSEITKAMNLLSEYVDVRAMNLDSALFHASERGINEAIIILLRAGANPNYKAPTGWTPLLMAASNGHAEAVKALLQKGADPNDQNVFAAHTPLILASQNKHVDTVKVLVEAGADVSRQNEWGYSALGYAKGNAELERILKEA